MSDVRSPSIGLLLTVAHMSCSQYCPDNLGIVVNQVAKIVEGGSGNEIV